MADKTVPYLGTKTIEIQTYTTTYAYKRAGWQFPGCPTPLEYAAYYSVDAHGANVFQGVSGNIFSRDHVTPFSVGTLSGTASNGYSAVAWVDNRLMVIGLEDAGTTGINQPKGVDYAFPLDGVGITDATPAFNTLYAMPNGSNTTSPSPYLGMGGLINCPVFGDQYQVGMQFSVRLSLVDYMGYWVPGLTDAKGLSGLSFDSTTKQIIALCPATVPGPVNHVFLNSTLGLGDGNPMYAEGDMQNMPPTQTVQYNNPPGTFDLDGWIHTAVNGILFRPTNEGFLVFVHTSSAVIVDGVSCTDFGILINRDMSGYYILQITPTDTQSTHWADALNGQVWGKIDTNCDLWLKSQNVNNILYISTSPLCAGVLPSPNPPIGTGIARKRAWTFTLDGHTFYVLDLGTQGTWVYDTSTDKWSRWYSTNQTQWAVSNGVMWGRRVVGGDLTSSSIWEVKASALTDNGADIPHCVTGGIVTRTREYNSVERLLLTVSGGKLGNMTAGSTILMRFSDDEGVSWSDVFTYDLAPTDYAGEVDWRSLGAFAAPGRIFQIADVGGPLRIDGCDAAIENFDNDQEEGQ